MNRRVLPVIIVVLALLAAACATDKDDARSGPGSTETTAEPATRTTRGITDTSIKVGGVVDETQFLLGGHGAGARFLRTNREGGVHGRQIDYIGTTSDTRDANLNADIVRRLVQQEQVAIVAPVLTSRFGGAEFLDQEAVPYFGWGISREWCAGPTGFGVTGCLVNPDPQEENGAWGVVLAEYFDGDTDRSVAVVGVDDDASVIGVEAVAASVTAAGFDAVTTLNSIPTGVAVTDYTPFAQEVLTVADGSAPDVVLQILPANDTIGLTRKLGDLDYAGLHVSAVGYDPQLLAVPAFGQHFLVMLQWAPFEADVAAVAQMRDDFAAYDAANGTTTPFNLANAASYWSADLLVAALEAVGPDLTIERLVATLNDDFTFAVPGALGEVRFPRNHTVPVPCLAGVQIEGGAYVEKVPLTCAELVPVR